MGERSEKNILLAAVIWIVILAALAATYKYFIQPHFQEALTESTGSESRYKYTVTLAADSFSGYCVLRSGAFRDELKGRGVRLKVQDDQADYDARIKALAAGKVQMAVFTVDSLLTAGARLGKFPATIVLVIDETKGADAIVAYRKGLSSLQDLNHPDARLVLTPNSPSEFLARVVIAHFSLPRLPQHWSVAADGAADVYKRFRAASPQARHAYVLWEPYVSRALEEQGAHLLLGSDKLRGLIVDVLVAERKFLRDQPERVRDVAESYFRALHAYRQKAGGMLELIMADAKATGAEPLTRPQAEKLVQGIAWKNTLENYAHFALLGPSALPAQAPSAGPGGGRDLWRISSPTSPRCCSRPAPSTKILLAARQPRSSTTRCFAGCRKTTSIPARR